MEKEKLEKTVDKIAVEVVKNTEAIKNLDTKVTNLDTKVDNLDTKVNNLDTKVDNLDTKVNNLDTKVKNLDTKVTNLDTKVNNLDTKVTNLDTKVEVLDKRVGKIAVEVVKHTEAIKNLVTKEEFGEFKNESLTRLDKVITMLSRIDQERVFTVERTRHLEEEVDKIKVHLAL